MKQVFPNITEEAKKDALGALVKIAFEQLRNDPAMMAELIRNHLENDDTRI